MADETFRMVLKFDEPSMAHEAAKASETVGRAQVGVVAGMGAAVSAHMSSFMRGEGARWYEEQKSKVADALKTIPVVSQALGLFTAVGAAKGDVKSFMAKYADVDPTFALAQAQMNIAVFQKRREKAAAMAATGLPSAMADAVVWAEEREAGMTASSLGAIQVLQGKKNPADWLREVGKEGASLIPGLGGGNPPGQPTTQPATQPNTQPETQPPSQTPTSSPSPTPTFVRPHGSDVVSNVDARFQFVVQAEGEIHRVIEQVRGELFKAVNRAADDTRMLGGQLIGRGLGGIL